MQANNGESRRTSIHPTACGNGPTPRRPRSLQSTTFVTGVTRDAHTRGTLRSWASNVEQLHSDLRSLWSGSLLARCKDAIARILLMMPRTTLEAPNKLASRTGALETDKPLKVKPQKHQFVVGKFTCFPYPSINLSASNSWHWRSLVRAKPGHGPPSPKRELTNTPRKVKHHRQ